MNIFEKALEKAKKEGKISPELLVWNTVSAATSGNVSDNGKPDPAAQIAILDKFPEETISEFEQIMENLRIQAHLKKVKVIGISGIKSGQGTSTIAAMLATLASGKKSEEPDFGDEDDTPEGSNKKSPRPQGVLLIDSNLQHPGLHQIFELPLEGGIWDIIVHDMPHDIGTNNIPNSDLTILTAGKSKDVKINQDHYLRFKSFLDQLRSRFEYIILDIPPLLHSAEGTIFSQLCDGMVLVLNTGTIKWEVIQETKKRLETANISVLGAVLNRRRFFIPEKIYRLIF
jgi:Mrp family chromosome partitioning ATPase